MSKTNFRSTGLRFSAMAGSVVLIIDLGSKIPDPPVNFAWGYNAVGLFPSLGLHYARNYEAF